MAILKKCKQPRVVIDPRDLNCLKVSKDGKLVMHTHKNETNFQLKEP